MIAGKDPQDTSERRDRGSDYQEPGLMERVFGKRTGFWDRQTPETEFGYGTPTPSVMDKLLGQGTEIFFDRLAGTAFPPHGIGKGLMNAYRGIHNLFDPHESMMSWGENISRERAREGSILLPCPAISESLKQGPLPRRQF